MVRVRVRMDPFSKICVSSTPTVDSHSRMTNVNLMLKVNLNLMTDAILTNVVNKCWPVVAYIFFVGA